MSEWHKMSREHRQSFNEIALLILDRQKHFIPTLKDIHGLPEYVAPKKPWWRFW